MAADYVSVGFRSGEQSRIVGGDGVLGALFSGPILTEYPRVRECESAAAEAGLRRR